MFEIAALKLISMFVRNQKDSSVKILLRKDQSESTDGSIIQKLKPGDHICSGRMNDAYSHHGVYIGDNRVIQVQGQHDPNSISNTVPCNVCGYLPHKEGTVVWTCLSCFQDGGSLSICEYGIRVTEADLDAIYKKLHLDGIIYTIRNGKVHLGQWQPDNTVLHYVRPHYNWVGSVMCQKCPGQPFKKHYSKKKYLAKTCLECFCGRGLLFLNEHQLLVSGTDTDNKISTDTSNILQETVLKILIPPRLPSDWFSKVFEFLLPSPDTYLVYKDKRVQVYHQHSLASADEVVRNAYWYLEHSTLIGIYDAITNNCEHFASLCKTGVRFSTQVTDIQLHAFLIRICGHGCKKLKEKCKLAKVFRLPTRQMNHQAGCNQG